MNRMLVSIAATAMTVIGCFLVLQSAQAQSTEIRLARQFSMGYLQFNVMEHARLIEKHAAALGLADVKVSWATFNGPNAMNDALIAGRIDVVSGGAPGLLTLWGKTKGTAQEVRGVAALSSQPALLNTRDTNANSIADLTDTDRIALPAVKVSIQAVILQMAAAKLFGQDHFAKLDPLTVSMAPPDATIALMSGAAGITCAFSVPPYQQQQLEQPGIKTLLNSFDVLQGPHTFTLAWTSKAFHDHNPVLYKALIAALQEATDIINKDRRAAAALWIEDVNSKLSLDTVEKVVSGPQVKWTMVPENTMKFASFMHSVGSLREAPTSWRDLFFSEIHELDGS